jgi:hypothetical protein
MNIGTNVWGPHGWAFIHYITLGYPNNPSDKDKQDYYNFFRSLFDVIPCVACANNYKKHIKEYPLDNKVLSNKQSFINWGIDMHNAVNKLNNKKIYSYEDGLQDIIKNIKFIYKKKTKKNIKYVKNTNNIKKNSDVNTFVCPYKSSPTTKYIMIGMIVLIVILLQIKFSKK